MAAIEISDLVKRYGDVEAVRGVTLDIEEGEVFALLGPNGAGKTTIVEILEGHREATSGTVRVLGHDPAAGERSFKSRIGIVLQAAGVDGELTPREALELFGPIYPKRLPVERVIELVGLGDKADARIKSLSGGQQRRVDLALGIVGDPDLIFLDEPTTGFDPSARRRSWDLLDRLRSLGKTILLTTHYMDEAQHLADRVAVMAEGRIVAVGDPSSLGGDAVGTLIGFRIPADVAAADLPGGPWSSAGGGRVERNTDRPTAVLAELTGWAAARGLELPELEVRRPSLEDVYLDLTDGETK